jgi:hypothetical protein
MPDFFSVPVEWQFVDHRFGRRRSNERVFQ